MGSETRAVPVPADRVWAALTEPAALREWAGDLDRPLHEGRLSRLDRGDGDVEVLEVIRLAAPQQLSYRRRLFGIDVKETIRWAVTPAPGGCLVGVGWSGPQAVDDRPDGEFEQWHAELDRLESYLAGEPMPQRPAGREFRLGTDLPGEPSAVRSRFAEFLATVPAVGDVTLRVLTGERLTVVFEHPQWPLPATARVAVLARGQGTRLVVRHRGWGATAYDEGSRRRNRARFAAAWHRLLLRFTLAYAREWRIPTLTPADLDRRMGEPGLVVLDANRETLWERGHLPQAVFVGQEDLPLDRLPDDPAAELVFYCRDSMCLTAYLSAAKARTLGYRHTYVMEGGRQAWADAGLPLVPENAAGVIEIESAGGSGG